MQVPLPSDCHLQAVDDRVGYSCIDWISDDGLAAYGKQINCCRSRCRWVFGQQIEAKLTIPVNESIAILG